jgi:hypothetical protein
MGMKNDQQREAGDGLRPRGTTGVGVIVEDCDIET